MTPESVAAACDHAHEVIVEAGADGRTTPVKRWQGSGICLPSGLRDAVKKTKSPDTGPLVGSHANRGKQAFAWALNREEE